MISRELVYQMLTKEDAYAHGWAGPRPGGHKDSYNTSTEDGQPWGMMDFLVFAEKYLADAKRAWAEYTPDDRAIRIRFLKAASLLVTALEVHGDASDLDTIAGVSSNRFPIYHGGLETYKQLT